MNMIDVLQRLAELDAKNPNVVKESGKPLEECGGMMGGMGMSQPHTPASINMTAATGEELSSMLRDIMTLAGQSKDDDDDAIAAEPVGGVGALTVDVEPEMGPPEPDEPTMMRSMIDKLNPDADSDFDSMGDEEDDEEQVEEYDNTPNEQTTGYGSMTPTGNDMHSKGGEAPKVNGGGNPTSIAATYESLMKEYRKFVSESEQGMEEGNDWTGPLYDPALQGSGKKQRYEMMFKNGQVKRFSAMNDNEARKIAAGHGAKSVIRMKGNVPGGKVSEQGLAEGADVEYVIVIRDEQGKRSIRVSALTPTDAKEKAEAQGYKVLKVKDPREANYFREQEGSERFVYPEGQLEKIVKRLQKISGFTRKYPDPKDQMDVAYYVGEKMRRGYEFNRAVPLGIHDYVNSQGLEEGYSTMDLWNMSPKEVIELLDAKKITYDEYHAYQDLVIAGGPEEEDDSDYTDRRMRDAENQYWQGGEEPQGDDDYEDDSMGLGLDHDDSMPRMEESSSILKLAGLK